MTTIYSFNTGNSLRCWNVESDRLHYHFLFSKAR